MAESTSQSTLDGAVFQKQAKKTTLLAEKADLEARITAIDAEVVTLDAAINDLQTTSASIRPLPTLTGLDLTLVELESTGNTLVCTGTGFDAAYTRILVNGVEPTGGTTVNSATECQCVINDVDAQTIQTLAIKIENPAPGGGISSTLNLQVVYGVPTLTSLDVTTVPAGTGDTLVTLTGVNFYAPSVIWLNGSAVATTFVNNTTLQLTVPAAAFVTQGVPASIYVVNPTPGGGTSESQLITVT